MRTYIEFEPTLSIRVTSAEAERSPHEHTLPSDEAFVMAHHLAEEFQCDVMLTSPRNGHILYTIHPAHKSYWAEDVAPLDQGLEI